MTRPDSRVTRGKRRLAGALLRMQAVFVNHRSAVQVAGAEVRAEYG